MYSASWVETAITIRGLTIQNIVKLLSEKMKSIVGYVVWTSPSYSEWTTLRQKIYLILL